MSSWYQCFVPARRSERLMLSVSRPQYARGEPLPRLQHCLNRCWSRWHICCLRHHYNNHHRNSDRGLLLAWCAFDLVEGRWGGQVVLQPPVEVLRKRLAARWAEGRHFMPPSQLDAQMADLEVQFVGTLLTHPPPLARHACACAHAQTLAHARTHARTFTNLLCSGTASDARDS